MKLQSQRLKITIAHVMAVTSGGTRLARVLNVFIALSHVINVRRINHF